jgi:hypothetical protein
MANSIEHPDRPNPAALPLGNAATILTRVGGAQPGWIEGTVIDSQRATQQSPRPFHSWRRLIGG